MAAEQYGYTCNEYMKSLFIATISLFWLHVHLCLTILELKNVFCINKWVLIPAVILLTKCEDSIDIAKECEFVIPDYNVRATDAPSEHRQEDIFFCSPDTGYTVGQYGSIYKTIDGGVSWTDQNPDHEITNQKLNSVFFVDPETGFAAGEERTFAFDPLLGADFLTTTNGGLTWIKLQSSDIHSFHDIHFYDPYHGLATAQIKIDSHHTTPKLARTKNGGEDWEEIVLPYTLTSPSKIYSQGEFIYLLAEDSVHASTLLVLSDRAESWYAHSIPGYFCYKLFPANETILIVSCELIPGSGTAFLSEDQGQSWEMMPNIPVHTNSIVHFNTDQSSIVINPVTQLVSNEWETISVLTGYDIFTAEHVYSDWSNQFVHHTCRLYGLYAQIHSNTFYVLGDDLVSFTKIR